MHHNLPVKAEILSSICFINMLCCSSILLILICSCRSSQPWQQTTLYFGLRTKEGDLISDSAWNVFVVRQVNPVFSSGFTVIHGEGSWMDARTNRLVTEPVRIVIHVHKRNSRLAAGIDSLRAFYKKNFLQSSVLRVDKKVHVHF